VQLELNNEEKVENDCELEETDGYIPNTKTDSELQQRILGGREAAEVGLTEEWRRSAEELQRKLPTAAQPVFLNQDQVLSCIPPDLEYSNERNSMASSSFGQQQKYNKLNFDEFENFANEEMVRMAMFVNIFKVLNTVMEDEGITFTNQCLNNMVGMPNFIGRKEYQLILTIEVKKEWVLPLAKTVISQAYTYIASNRLQYGVLTTLLNENSQYELPQRYPFRARKNNSNSAPQEIIELSGSANFQFGNFVGSYLGYGRSGTTFSCKYNGQDIALKLTDLSKKKFLLPELLKEIEIYHFLADIQGLFIPKLVGYGYM
ncbi:12112_t:CDS:2, partial [Funneliformis geosporum]